jgi:DNA-binding NarL/FixJ family response regulator
MSRVILVVADDGAEDFRQVLQQAAPDCVIVCASTRREIASLARPSLIIIDLLLSSEPAAAILSWLRSRPEFRDIPVFVLGSKILARDVAETYKLGATSCFVTERAGEELRPLAQGIAAFASLLPAARYA